MRDKKHIDRLFQEGLKDFEATPSNAVWENIEAELNKDKKKRRIIPIWWRYAGVAALLLVFLTLGINTLYNTSEDNIEQEIVDTKSKNTPELEKTSVTNENHLNTHTNSAISNNTSEEEENTLKSETDHHINNQNTNKHTPNTTVASTIAHVESTENANHIQNSTKKQNTSSSLVKGETKTLHTNTNNTIAREASEENNGTSTTPLALNPTKTDITTKENAIVNNVATSKNDDTENTLANNTVKPNEKNSLTIEEALDKNKDLIKDESPIDRWSLAANAAPVYFNTTGKGSSIDPQFNSNSKTGEVNMSYGVTASYAVNKRLRIRSGVNRVNLGYNTNDVVGYQAIGVSANASTLQNISKSNNTSNNDFVTTNSASSESLSLISANNLTEKSASSLKTTNSSINQSLGYIEVPLELQYALINRKFGVNVIGGFSSLFLNNNEVFSETQDGNRTFLGEANNLNKISYSANFGLGLNYQVSKKIGLNLEPMLKYQINTFNNTSGDFQPFFVGVYTGIGFKF